VYNPSMNNETLTSKLTAHILAHKPSEHIVLK
jgi:hypothetical protein